MEVSSFLMALKTKDYFHLIRTGKKHERGWDDVLPGIQ
jgi:hypothetical protein